MMTFWRCTRRWALVALTLAAGPAGAETPKQAPPPPSKATGDGLAFKPRIPITDPRTKQACLDRKLTAECHFDGLSGTCQPFECLWEGPPDPDEPPGSKTYYPCVRCAVPPEGFEPPQAKKSGGGHGAEAGHGEAAKAEAGHGEAAKAEAGHGEAAKAEASHAPPPPERCAPTAGAPPDAAPAPESEGGGCGGGAGAGVLAGLAALLATAVRRR